MDQEIYFTNKEFDFSQISVSQPISVQGGAYFTKIKMNSEPLYVQPPKCCTKQGLNETNKKAYMDLMFTNEDDEVVEWFEHLEERLIQLIYEKREIWFQNEMDKDDIENFFNPICRAFKGGKFHLIRLQIPKNKTASSQYHCNVYDENENIVAIQDLNDTHTIIPCIEVQGIKFSARNFQLELVGKQIMLLNNKPIFNSCVIKRSNTNTNSKNDNDNSKNDMEHMGEIKNNTNDINTNLNLSQTDDDEAKSLTITDSLGKNVNEPGVIESQILQRSGKTNSNEEVVEDVEDVEAVFEEAVEEAVEDKLSIKGLQKNIVAALTESDSESGDDEENDTKNDATYDTNNSNHLEENTPIISNSFDLEDITDNLNVHDDRNIKLKKPNEVYYEIYKIAKGKAKQHKKAAITHYLEAKKIKNTYLIDDLDYSDDSMDEDDDDEDDEDDKDESNKIKNQINEIVEDLI
jgi:hypothetical protein